MAITITTSNDWRSVAKLAGPVVDPMILRCGELFLRGASGVSDPAGAWDLMTKNIHAIGSFFDRVVLDEHLPVFNYADTFDIGQNLNQRTLSAVNATEEILVDVDVAYGPYMEVKGAALEELKRLYSDSDVGVATSEANSILGELTSSGYAWYPDLGGMAFDNDQERRLASFILGGLVFGAYAQLTGADHLMQPKRSRLFLAISLREESSRSAEEFLFNKLGASIGRPTAEVPYTPTFFPLLLGMSNGPAELLDNALSLRATGEVRDYRAWLDEALDDFDRNGHIPIARSKEVASIATAIQSKIGGSAMPDVSIKMTVADIAAAKPPGVSIDLTKTAKAAWGWTISQLPGKRHRKLLTRALIADAEYVKLDNRVQTVWNGPGCN